MKLSLRDNELNPLVELSASLTSGSALASEDGTKLEAPTFHEDLGINGFDCWVIPPNLLTRETSTLSASRSTWQIEALLDPEGEPESMVWFIWESVSWHVFD